MPPHSLPLHESPQSQTYLFDSDKELKAYIVDSDVEVVKSDSDIEWLENNWNQTQPTLKQETEERIQLRKSRSIEARPQPSNAPTDPRLDATVPSNHRHQKRTDQEKRRGYSRDSDVSKFDTCKAEDKKRSRSPRPDRRKASRQACENIIQKQDLDDVKVKLDHDDTTDSRSDRCDSPVPLSSNEATATSNKPPRKRIHSETGDAEVTFSTSHSWRNERVTHSNSTNHLDEQCQDEPLKKQPEFKRPKLSVDNQSNLGHLTDGLSRAKRSKPAYRIPKIIPACEPDEFGRYESSSCHQCKVNTTRPKMMCDQSQDPTCVVRVCITCLMMKGIYDHHPELRPPIFSFVAGGRMLCVKCRDLCPCVSCRRGRGEKVERRRGPITGFYGLTPKGREKSLLKKQEKCQSKQRNKASGPSNEKTGLTGSSKKICELTSTNLEDSDGSEFNPGIHDDEIRPRSPRPNRSRVSLDKRIENGNCTQDAMEAPQQLELFSGLTTKERLRALSKKRKTLPAESDGSDFTPDVPDNQKPRSPVRYESKQQKKDSRPPIEKTLSSESHPQFDDSLDAFTQWKNSFERDDKAQLASTLLSKQNIPSALLNRKAISVDKRIFSNKLTAQATPVTAQKPGGRCWLFATCNVTRMGIVRKFDLGDFELSQSYVSFYDLLDKANHYLENMIELVEEPINARIISHLAISPLCHAGQWDMAVGLIEKYGLVPQSIYDESYSSSNSGGISTFLTSKLRDQGLELRRIYNDAKVHAIDDLGQDSKLATTAGVQAARQAKESMMAQVYRCLAIALGCPPSPTETFRWDYLDRTGKAHSLVSTPLDFYHKQCAGFQASEYISLINDPRNSYNKSYTVERLGNIWGGRPIKYVNTSTDVLKSILIKMIKADKPVWFGCDASKMSNSSYGIMDTKLIDYECAFGVTSHLSKSDRLQMYDSAPTHVMVITAVHLDEQGKPVRYKVENSWCDTAGAHGCFVMTDAWFDEYVFQIVLPRSFTPDSLRQIYDDSEPSVLRRWDPMASLA